MFKININPTKGSLKSPLILDSVKLIIYSIIIN